jgi:hypothetical protein
LMCRGPGRRLWIGKVHIEEGGIVKVRRHTSLLIFVKILDPVSVCVASKLFTCRASGQGSSMLNMRMKKLVSRLHTLTIFIQAEGTRIGLIDLFESAAGVSPQVMSLWKRRQ